MTLLLAVVTAQLADLTAYVAAVVRFPAGEANPLQSGSPSEVVVTKAVGIAIMAAILVVGRVRLRRLYPVAVAVVAVPALVGAWTAVVNGGLWRW